MAPVDHVAKPSGVCRLIEEEGANNGLEKQSLSPTPLVVAEFEMLKHIFRMRRHRGILLKRSTAAGVAADSATNGISAADAIPPKSATIQLHSIDLLISTSISS